MHMTFNQRQGAVPVTVLSIHGDLDGSTYRDAIAGAQSLYDKGTRNLLLDIGDVPFMSSAGVVALASIAALMRGDAQPDPESGWNALHALEQDINTGVQQHLKLLNPQPNVDKVLDTVGLKSFLEIHTDLNSAVASFA